MINEKPMKKCASRESERFFLCFYASLQIVIIIQQVAVFTEHDK